MASARAELELADWRRLNGLLERGLEYTRTERQRWLGELDTGDRHLAPLLGELLERAEDVTEPPAVGGPGLSRLAFQAEDHVGDPIGPYRLLREIARGGMGVVWLAERADGSFQRQVALKLPPAEFVSRGWCNAWRASATSWPRSCIRTSPSCTTPGSAPNGRPYLALEYVEGEAIDAYCARRELNVAARVALFTDVVNTVAYRARAPGRAPGYQAEQHAGDRHGPDQAARLRHRQAARGRRPRRPRDRHHASWADVR